MEYQSGSRLSNDVQHHFHPLCKAKTKTTDMHPQSSKHKIVALRAGKKGANKSTKMLEIKKPTTLLGKVFLLPLFATKAIKMIFMAIVCIPTKIKTKGNATALIIVAKPVMPPAASPVRNFKYIRPTAKIAQPGQ